MKLLPLLFALTLQTLWAAEFQTDLLSYEIGADGRNKAMRNRRTGKNYLARPSAFLTVVKDGRRIESTGIIPDGENLRVKFGDSGIETTVRVRSLPQYLTFELAALSDPSIAYVELANLPLTLTKYVSGMLASCRDDEYAAAVIPLNMETHSASKEGTLIAEADHRVRLAGTKFAVLGCPTAELLDRVERIELENGLPHPTLGGVWARRSPEQMRSYLFVDLSEATADAMIDYAKAGGFGYIVVYDGVWNASHGTYPVHRKNFPAGPDSLKAVSRKIHAAGLKFGMHNLDMIVDKSDALVHPVPAAGFMMYPDRRRTLAAGINAAVAFVPTTTSPAGLLAKADKSRFHGRDLRIGDEIITYDDLQLAPPYGFTGCTRGAHGTAAAAHPAGAAIENFSEFIDFYRPDVKSELYDRVARAAAASLDEYGFDYIYPDGTGENLGFWPDEPVWYAYNIVISKLFGYTKREVLWGHAPINDYSWHIFSRGNTTDFVQTGVMRHFDRVSVAGAKNSMVELQPFEFGWFGYFNNALDVVATRPREMEYAWSKALAYGAAMSLETNKKALDANGRTREIFSTIRKWEELKLHGAVPARLRERLKSPGVEFGLDGAGIVPVSYSPEKYVTAKETWTYHNPHRAQPPRVTVDAMSALAQHGDAANVVLLDPSGKLNLSTSGAGPLGEPARQTPGVVFALKPSATDFRVSAANQGLAAEGWGCAEIILDGGPKDLSRHRALGVWVQGDGSGAYLHFVLEDSGRWSVRDYYVRLDFKGRRYIEIPESAKGEIYDFAFPYSNYWAIRNINFRAITRLYVFLTGLKPGQAVNAGFGRVEALEERRMPLENLTLGINGESVTFPARLETGWYLEFTGQGKARVFDANGFTMAEVAPAGAIPTLRAGMNRIDSVQQNAPYKVTLSTRGEPLD